MSGGMHRVDQSDGFYRIGPFLIANNDHLTIEEIEKGSQRSLS
jgi:hypothetical protein